jgi:hypothetical protein
MADASPTRIPNRFIMLWSGPRFPLHARIAVESILLADPTTTVELHLFGERPTEAPHFRAVAELERVELHHLDPDTAFARLWPHEPELRRLYDAIPAEAHSARSNLLRYAVLYDRGGIYVDFDIVMLRDLRHLLDLPAFVGEERVWRVDEARVEGRRASWMIAPTLAYLAAWAIHPTIAFFGGAPLADRGAIAALDRAWSAPALNNAVLGAEPGSPWIRRLLVAALDASPTVRFALGPSLVTRAWDEDSSDVVRLACEAFYCEPPSYSFRFFSGRPGPLPPEALLIHHVSSNHGRLLQALDHDLLRDRADGPLFYRLAADVARRAESLPRRHPPRPTDAAVVASSALALA